MKAAVYHQFHGPIVVQDDVPYPRVPDDGIVLQVKATGICRSDWHGWAGHDADILKHGLPFVPGHEVSGIVVEVGKFARDTFQPGDGVAVPFLLSCGTCPACLDDRPTVCHDQEQPGFTRFGSFAEYVAIPRAHRNVCILPKDNTVSFVQAAALGCRFTTAHRAVLQQGKYGCEEHQTIAVFGCGGLGLSCIMIAAAAQKNKRQQQSSSGEVSSSSLSSSKIIAVDISEAALRKALELGATDAVLCRPDDDDDSSYKTVQEQIFRLTNQQGAHLTVDAAGFASTCENAIYSTRRSGRMVQVGLVVVPPIVGQDVSQLLPRVPMGWVVAREIEIVGSHGFAADSLPELLDLVATGALDPSLLVERCVDLREGVRVLMEMDNTSPLGITMITDFTCCSCAPEASRL